MANLLTGDYQAVVQIALRQISGLLATLHQIGAAEDAPLKLLHSVSTRVGDPRRRTPDVDAFGDWVLEYQRARSRGRRDALRAELVGTAPPGAARFLSDAFKDLDGIVVLEDPPDVVHGRAELQLSPVAITIPPGSTSEVNVQAHVRGRYFPDAGTTDLAAPIHGEVNAAFDVRKVQTSAGRRLLIQPTSQDSKIQFTQAPGSGLSAVEVNKIAAQVRKFVREGFTLLPVDLPRDFPFSDFKGLAGEFEQVVALPLQLTGPGLPSTSLQSVTHPFVGSSGFAFAVSQEHVRSLIDIEAIREAIKSRSLTLTLSRFGVSVSVTYHFRFSSGPTLTFRPGVIEIAGRVEVETGSFFAPNGFVSFKQAITLVLDAAHQSVSLQPVGEPEVDKSFFIPRGTAVNIVKSEMAKALSSNTLPVQRVFDGARSNLVKGLRTFDRSASALYTEIQITPDGVIVRGDIGGAARHAPVVDIAETDRRTAFTAFQSWIPAGRIDRFIWSWVEYGLHSGIWAGVSKTLTEEHRFIFPKPSGITELSQVCLRIEGTQTLPSGREVTVAAGTTCHLPEREIIMDVPSWWEPVLVPVWLPDLTDDVLLKDAVAGHISVQTDTPRRDELTQNTLVVFADWNSARPLDGLADALARTQEPSVSLGVIVVLPSAAFDGRRREVEGRLASLLERLSTRLQVTEDAEGGWTRTFGATKTPSFYLINARREFVWKHEGALDPAALAAALEEHLLPAPAPRARPLRLAVSPGDRAPDASFQDDGNNSALHRLRGQRVLVNFWQSWSAPCLKELRRLQSLHGQPREAPFVVAFHGGSDAKALDAIRKQLGLTFALVQDSEQQVARRFGVRCWPTTIQIDAEGQVEHIQFGIARDHEAVPGLSKAEGPS
jgi:peroxiredoxin